MESILVSLGEAHLHIAPGSCIEVLRFYDKLHPGAKCCFRSPSARYHTKTGLHPLCKQFSRTTWDKALPLHWYRKETYADIQINTFRANEELSAQYTYEVSRLRGH